MVELHRLGTIDWEPAVLHFHFLRDDYDHAVRVQEYCAHWFQGDKGGRSCSCSLVFLKVWMVDTKTVEALCEWLCESCIAAFTNGLADTLPELDRVELGISDETTPEQVTDAFVDVPAQEVEFEDGRRIFVNAFQVSRHQITISQYQAFVDATGYRTMADRKDEFENDRFYYNSITQGLRKKDIANTHAVCLSLYDCLAYCQWAGCRLPTEAEWMAASVADLEFSGDEWTAAFDADGKAVVRSGPRRARTTDWKEKVSRHRGAIDPEHYDIMTAFRVVRRTRGNRDAV